MARHMTDSQHSISNHQLFLRPSFRMLWKIISDRVPGRAIGDERMKLRPNSGIVVECAHANRYLRSVRPIAPEQTRTAIRTKRLHSALTFSIDLDQFLALKQTELLAQHTRLSANRRSGMLAATFAMTMAGLNEWRINFKSHAATQTTPLNG